MYILGIETSTKTGSVAIATEDHIIAMYTLNIEVTHSERLMSTIDRVLSDTGIAMSDIDGFGVAIGPGSFTGLRIGLATVKGLAFATGKPVAAVPTLRALAWNLPFSAYPVCPMLDARKSEIYTAIFRSDAGTLVQLMPERAMALSLLAAEITGPTVFTGEAAKQHEGELLKLCGANALFAPLSAMVPSAAGIAELARAMIIQGAPSDIENLHPLYLRRPEAEVAWEKKQLSP